MPDEKPLDIVRLRAWVKGRIERSVPDARIDYCLTCGLCASGCPATGIDGLDPRKFLRLLVLGQDDEILKTNWIYTCTMCQRCRYVCPMGIDVGRIVYEIRGMRPRDERPRNLQRSCDLQKETNSTGIPNEDFVWVVRDVLEEVRQNEPEWADINAPIDKAGAEYYLNQNAKEPTVEPEEMVPLWKILHAAGIDWTYSSKWWDGANYCLFTGDAKDWEMTVRKQAEVVDALGCRYYINTE
ncbi:4Fe-4S dicluster domain-containing protein [Dissulfurimicrobium hydrothermale]|uniref:4Fe-4S dicluster domain-containing protein n=1 Tax=Dissulfurimicrobium hydrothermale TaxID=1750598 RepID=UPI001ED9E46A|nr:4Fe-4S dicluster domain-containing protein [Dissulfurimicrobium hydrothermale]UKL13569.1 4Fe-4S dicluster domain-containing protein [Dissulfurimicrobium hydrothermale]